MSAEFAVLGVSFGLSFLLAMIIRHVDRRNETRDRHERGMS